MKRGMNSLLALVIMALAAGCAHDNGGDVVAVPPATIPDTTPTSVSATPTPIPGLAAGAVALTVLGGSPYAQAQLLEQMFFSSPVNNPTNVQMQMAVVNDGSGHYPGSVTISFQDGATTRTDTLSTTHPFGGTSDANENVWFNWQGATVWHGMFQDAYGAIVVVIDNNAGAGTGDGSGGLGGSVWFQNFGAYNQPGGPIQGPNSMCWEIQVGPYDCRTFITGGTGEDGVTNTTSSLYPNNSGDDRPAYQELGTFTGLNQQSAMGD